MPSPLQQRVIDRCKELGDEPAAAFFEVGVGLIRQWVAGSKTPSLAAVEKVYVEPDRPPADAGWEGRDVFLALPFYKTTSPRTLYSILGVWDREKFRAGVRFDNAYLIHTRNQLAADFLSTACGWSWWLDDDIIPPMGHAGWFNQFAEASLPEKFAGIHTPTRLRSHGKSIVSAVYSGRSSNGRAMYAEALGRNPEGDRENEWVRSGPHDLIKPTQFAGFGCIMITRQVFLDIKNTYPHLAPEAGEPFHFFSNASDEVLRAMPEMKEKIAAATLEVKGGSGEAALRILDDLVKQVDFAYAAAKRGSRLQQAEDRTFCQRAAQAGHVTFVDFAVVCGHIGQKVFNPQNTKP